MATKPQKARELRQSNYFAAFTAQCFPLMRVVRWMWENDATPEQAYVYFLSEGHIRDPELDELIEFRQTLVQKLAEVNDRIAAITPVLPPARGSK